VENESFLLKKLYSPPCPKATVKKPSINNAGFDKENDSWWWSLPKWFM
jgi:hypothetical protein